ncbi:unnamed protein product [Ilex paraguariensis]|uniref:Uncharacterized protein n=1 Tax=Ilex paraguariensis TaxID=185542 RepID=A0ABC8UKK3_9AQUA
MTDYKYGTLTVCSHQPHDSGDRQIQRALSPSLLCLGRLSQRRRRLTSRKGASRHRSTKKELPFAVKHMISYGEDSCIK